MAINNKILNWLDKNQNIDVIKVILEFLITNSNNFSKFECYLENVFTYNGNFKILKYLVEEIRINLKSINLKKYNFDSKNVPIHINIIFLNQFNYIFYTNNIILFKKIALFKKLLY